MSEARLTIATTRHFNFSHIMCFVVVFEDRVILAHIDDDKRREIASEFKEKRKAAGITSVASLTDMVKMLDEYANRYREKTDVQILEENDLNVMLMAEDVTKVIFNKSHFDYQKEDGKRKEGKLIFKTKIGKFKLTHKYLDNDESIRMELRATFGELLK